MAIKARVTHVLLAVAAVAILLWGVTGASAALGSTSPPKVVASSYRVGATLYADPGTWSGNPASFSFQWKKCKLDPGLSCVSIPGETGPTHVVTAADTVWNEAGFLPERSFMFGIRVVVEVTASDGSTSLTVRSPVDHNTPSVTTAPVAGATQTFGAPTAGVPEIDGTITPVPPCTGNTGPLCVNPLGWYYKIGGRYPLPEAGSVSSFSAYFAGGASAQAFTPALYRVDNQGEPTRLIVRGAPFTVPAGAPAGWFGSSFTSPVLLPAGTYLLAFLGGATDRGAIPSFYIPAQSIGVSNVNRNLDPSLPGYNDISLVPSDGFGPVEHYAGEIPKAYVTYTTAASGASLAANGALPALSGTAQQGQSLSATTGAWSGSPLGYTYQWQRCNPAGASCVDLAGQVASAYTLGAADAGQTLRAKVRAVNDAGASAFVASAASAVVAGGSPPAAPVNTGLPVISGTAQSGQVLTTSNGTWSNSPTSFAYQWQRCNPAGASCAAIVSETAVTHTASAADVGSTVRVVVTASNAGGPASATSAASAVVSAAAVPAPVNTTPPAVSGSPQSGQALTTSNGTWSNGPTSFAYQWQRCNAAGASCAAIAGATAATLSLGAADVGSTIRAAVTATNAGGPATAVSGASAVVIAPAVTPPASGGGGGGGGAPDVVLTQVASASTAAAGDTILYRIEVRLKNAASVSGATHVVVTDVLPAGVQLVSTKANRGLGCSGATTVTCDLDFLSGALVGTVEVVVRVTTAGTLVNTASARAIESDPDLTNNAVSVTVGAPASPVAPLAPPIVIVRAPKLTHRPVSIEAVLRPVVKAGQASLTTRVELDRKATVTLRVRDVKTGRAVTLRPGTRLGPTTATVAATAVKARFAAAKLMTLRTVFGASQLVSGKPYQLVLTATGASGKTSSLSVRFTG